MNFQSNILPFKTLRRANRGGPSSISSVSVFKSGNLNVEERHVEDLADDDISEIDYNEIEHGCDVSSEELSLDDYKRADTVLSEVFGIPIIENFAKLILNEGIKPKDILVQSLAYQIMKKIRGSSGVRYQDSYGMFWASIRNIIKSAGLVPFLDHFTIPTDLSKYKKKLLHMCGLKEETLGKSGLQEKNVEHWLNAKVNETKCTKLCVSVAIDGKKIAMSSDGIEDMGVKIGQNMGEIIEKEKTVIINDITVGDRESLFSAYDSLTSISQEVSQKIGGISNLIKKNTKRAEKNALLLKYVFVLKEQLQKGKSIIMDVENLQLKVLDMLCEKRKTSKLLPVSSCVDLSSQGNYRQLRKLSSAEDQEYVSSIQKLTAVSILQFPWSKLILKNRSFVNIPQTSQTSYHLQQKCFLSSEHIFKACGLSNVTPLKDMKDVYQKAHSNTADELIQHGVSLNVVATLAAVISPMIFGNKCYIAEPGLFIANGIFSKPMMLVYNTSDDLEYVVRNVLAEDNINMFECKLETMALCLIDAHLSKSKTGCLLIQHSNNSCVVFMIPTNERLSQEMLSIISEYTGANKCIAKRPKETILRINAVRSELALCSNSCSILGSFPMVGSVKTSDTLQLDAGNCLLMPSPNLTPRSSICHDISIVKKEIGCMIESKLKFMSKQARELIAINASDMSGIPSSVAPHTILCGTFLTSNSLKVVGKQCLDRAIDMINSRGGEVLNIAVDGESLNLATTLSNGYPGTVLALAKYILKNMKDLSKDVLVSYISKNKEIKINTEMDKEEETENVDDEEDGELTEENLEQYVQDSIEEESGNNDGLSCCEFTSEDIEEWLKGDSTIVDQDKFKRAKAMKLLDLRLACLRFILPKAKNAWILKGVRRGSITIKLENGMTIPYFPNTVFNKTENGFFQTVSFDMAHISNLCRESAAKGKLKNMGLKIENLKILSEKEGYEYLKKIISMKNNTLEFDPMNQKASSSLFSEKTATGLKLMNDVEGAHCIDLLFKGVIEAFDPKYCKIENFY